MTKIASKDWIINNIGGNAWSTDLTNCPPYSEIIETGQYNITGTYDSSQLVKQSSISIAIQNYTVNVYNVPSYTVITFMHYNYNTDKYHYLGQIDNYNTTNINDSITFNSEYDEFEFDFSNVYFWLTAVDSTYQSTNSNEIYCLNYGSDSGPVLLDHYDKTPLGYSGQILSYDDLPNNVLYDLGFGNSVDDFTYELSITSDKVNNFNYNKGYLEFVNDTGDDLIIQLENNVDIYFSAGDNITVNNTTGITTGTNIYINFIKDGEDISNRLQFRYDDAPNSDWSPWSGSFSTQIYSTDLYTIDRGPIYVTYI